MYIKMHILEVDAEHIFTHWTHLCNQHEGQKETEYDQASQKPHSAPSTSSQGDCSPDF